MLERKNPSIQTFEVGIAFMELIIDSRRTLGEKSNVGDGCCVHFNPQTSWGVTSMKMWKFVCPSGGPAGASDHL